MLVAGCIETTNNQKTTCNKIILLRRWFRYALGYRLGLLNQRCISNNLHPCQFLDDANDSGVIEFAHARVDHLLKQFCIFNCG